MTPALRRWHTVFGQQSGFPPCCIAWYLDIWLPYANSDEAQAHFRRSLGQQFRADDAGGHDSFPDWGYRPCPSCRATGAKALILFNPPPYPPPDPDLAEMWL